MRHAFIDEHSAGNSFLHRFDPRVKIVLFFSFILCIVTTPAERFMTFGLYGLVLLIMVWLARVPVCYVLRKAAALAPCILFIALFLPFLKPGLVVFGFGFGPLKIAVSYNGLMAFWNVAGKSILSIICMILLTSTTGFGDLIKGLQRLRVSPLFLTIVSFMYRYLFVLEDETEKMLIAKQARSLSPRRWLEIRTLSNMIGVLFIRSYERAEVVYAAMRCRGYCGKIQTLHDFHISKMDGYFLALVLVVLINIRLSGA